MEKNDLNEMNPNFTNQEVLYCFMTKLRELRSKYELTISILEKKIQTLYSEIGNVHVQIKLQKQKMESSLMDIIEDGLGSFIESNNYEKFEEHEFDLMKKFDERND